MSFKPALVIDNLLGGINSKQRDTKIKDNEMVSIVGFDFEANTLRRAKGYTKLGTEADSTLTGKNLYKLNVLSGQDVLIKTIGTYIKFYDEVDDAWYKITASTFTTDLKWSFAQWGGYLYGNNGIDNWVFWQGNKRSTLNGAIVIGATTINLATGHGVRFPTSGKIMIQGEQITYTGKSTDQLTGVTGVLTNHPTGSTVVLELDATTYSTISKAKWIEFYKNRLYFIDYAAPTLLYYSKLADQTNPETDLLNFTSGGGTGDAGYGIAPDELVHLREYINGNSSSILSSFCKNGVAYAFTVTDGTSTTTSTFIPIRTMNSFPIQKQAVCVAENDLVMTDQLGHIRTLGYGDVNTPLNVKTISQLIEPSLEATYWDNICNFYFNRKLYVGGSQASGSANDIYYYHDSNYNAWGAYGHWDCIDFAEYNANLYGLSSVTGDVWKLNDGYSVYTDDATDNYEGDYYSEAVTKAYEFELSHQYKSVLKLRMDGFITSLAEVYLDVYLDGVLFNTFLISGENTNIQGAIPNVAVGTIVFGQGVFGGGLPSGSTRKQFVAQLQFNTIKNFLQVQFKLRMDGRNVDFEMVGMTVWARLESEELWLTPKIILAS
jgi:hypothetical protein